LDDSLVKAILKEEIFLIKNLEENTSFQLFQQQLDYLTYEEFIMSRQFVYTKTISLAAKISLNKYSIETNS
jgi:hypothetical protein